MNPEALALIRLHFFDIEVSIVSLFQSISNGLNWGDVASALKQVSRFWSYLYVGYVAFCALPSTELLKDQLKALRGLFAVLNVMTGMYLAPNSEPTSPIYRGSASLPSPPGFEFLKWL